LMIVWMVWGYTVQFIGIITFHGRANGDLNRPHYMKRHDMGIEREIVTLL
jgi:hypothetical protein